MDNENDNIIEDDTDELFNAEAAYELAAPAADIDPVMSVLPYLGRIIHDTEQTVTDTTDKSDRPDDY